MSVIKKKPFIEKVYESLSDEQKTVLKNQINASGNAITNKTISQIENGIHTYLLKLNEFLIVPCICIKTDDYEVALGYGNKQIINIYNLDTEVGTYTEIKEHCSIEELRRIVFGTGGGGGGEITPEQLAELMEGSDEVSVDLNEDESAVKIDLHAKEVEIVAPSTATSGDLSEEQVAALQESNSSYIVFNNEKYYLMDNEHVAHSLGYSHIGYENSKFISKNITITLSHTVGTWVLNTKEFEDDNKFKIELTSATESYSHFDFLSDNYAEEIKQYITSKGIMPFIEINITITTTGAVYHYIATRIDNLNNKVVLYAAKEDNPDDFEKINFVVSMETGHSGSPDGQTASAIFVNLESVIENEVTNSQTIDGISIPNPTPQDVDDMYNQTINGKVAMISWTSGSGGNKNYIVNSAISENKNETISIKFNNNIGVTYTVNEELTNVTAVVHKNGYTIQTVAPSGAITDGLLHIVILDAEPAQEYNGYLYFIKE